MQAPDAAPRALVAERLGEVLARPEFQPPSEGLLERLLRQLSGLFGGALPDSVGWVLLAVLLLALGLLVGWLLVQAFAQVDQRRPSSGPAPAARPGELADRVADLRRRAREARERGDLVLALRLAFFALVVGLSRRGGLEYREAWTNRELLERGRPSAEVAAELVPLLADLDAKTFGRVPVEVADVERFERLAQRWLESGREARS